MKDFFSEYGWLIVVGVIIVIAITMMTPLGTSIQNAITKFVTDFSSTVNIGS